jgi:hypothetical protein
MPAPTDSTTTADVRRRAFRELRAAPAAGAVFLVRAWVAIPVVEASLRMLGYKRTVGWIEAVPAGHAASGPSVLLGERLVAAAYRAHPLPGGCLPRSLVQYLLHRRDGTPARFVIGVRRPDRPGGANDPGGPRIEAHAWVEGPASAPTAADRFAPIFGSGDLDRA